MIELKPGQIWVGRCLNSHQPDLWFVYVLLSADEKEGELWWEAAKFMKGEFGASTHKFLEEEIRKLTYCGHIRNNLNLLN